MTIAQAHTLAAAAASVGGAVLAVNVVHLETAEAIAHAAERTGIPVVLQISQNCVAFHGALEPLARACLSIAASAAVPIAVHLDHAEEPALVRAAIALGVGSVMFDGSRLGYEENVARTAELTAHAHARGVAVEAELGEIGGKDGVHAPGARTDPGAAAVFAQRTGVDLLAVAVGSSHAMTERTASLDEDLIRRLHAVVSVPLVLHGSSGVPDDALRDAVRAGIAKVNVSTLLSAHFTRAVSTSLSARPDDVDSRHWIGEGRRAVADEVARLLGAIAPSPE